MGEGANESLREFHVKKTIQVLLERVLPPMKPIEQNVALKLPTGEGITAQGLGALARIKEVDELECCITKFG